MTEQESDGEPCFGALLTLPDDGSLEHWQSRLYQFYDFASGLCARLNRHHAKIRDDSVVCDVQIFGDRLLYHTSEDSHALAWHWPNISAAFTPPCGRSSACTAHWSMDVWNLK